VRVHITVFLRNRKTEFHFHFCFQFPLNWKAIFELLLSVSVSIFVFRLYIYTHALIRKTEFDVLDLRMKFRIPFSRSVVTQGVWRQFVDKMFISSRQPSFGRLVVHLDLSASHFSSSSPRLIIRLCMFHFVETYIFDLFVAACMYLVRDLFVTSLRRGVTFFPAKSGHVTLSALSFNFLQANEF
jgi:hypothetical protein